MHILVKRNFEEQMKFIEGNHERKTGWGVLKELFKHW